MKNEYGNISGGYIFDYLDKYAHNIAKDLIGACMTANANINFFKPIKKERDLQLIDYRIPFRSDNKINIYLYGEGVVANFTFIKIK